MYFRSSLIKQKKFSEVYKKVELQKILLKSIMKDYNLNKISRVYLGYKLYDYNKYSFFTCLRKSCVISNYPRSVSRLFKMTRHCVKYYASNGYIMGIRKSSF